MYSNSSVILSGKDPNPDPPPPTGMTPPIPKPRTSLLKRKVEDEAGTSGPTVTVTFGGFGNFRGFPKPIPVEDSENIKMDTAEPVSGRSGTSIFIQEEDDTPMRTADPSLTTVVVVEKPKEFGFEGMTLDEIIQFKKTMTGKGKVVIRQFDFDFEKDLMMSPMTVLQNIQKTGQTFSVAAKELIDADTIRGSRYHRWRGEWTFEDLKGVGEGARKMLAKQLGALDLVNKLRSEKKMKLPECRVPDGCLISPNIFTALERVAANAYFEIKYILDVDNSKVYITLCYIGEQFWAAISPCPAYSKRVAAKKAYDSVSESKFYPDPMIFGEACKDSSQYDGIESETSRITFVRRPIRTPQPGEIPGTTRASFTKRVVNIPKKKPVDLSFRYLVRNQKTESVRIVSDPGQIGLDESLVSIVAEPEPEPEREPAGPSRAEHIQVTIVNDLGESSENQAGKREREVVRVMAQTDESMTFRFDDFENKRKRFRQTKLDATNSFATSDDIRGGRIAIYSFPPGSSTPVFATERPKLVPPLTLPKNHATTKCGLVYDTDKCTLGEGIAFQSPKMYSQIGGTGSDELGPESWKEPGYVPFYKNK